MGIEKMDVYLECAISCADFNYSVDEFGFNSARAAFSLHYYAFAQIEGFLTND